MQLRQLITHANAASLWRSHLPCLRSGKGSIRDLRVPGKWLQIELHDRSGDFAIANSRQGKRRLAVSSTNEPHRVIFSKLFQCERKHASEGASLSDQDSYSVFCMLGMAI